MTQYKFNINKKGLSDEQVNKHKDFKKLMHEYDHMVNPLYRKPLYKNKKTWLIIFLILLIMYIIVEFTQKNTERDQTKESPTLKIDQ
jgi:hypothetical protein